MMNSFPPLFKSAHQIPSAGVTIAITMLATVASLLFVVNNFHHNSNIKLSLDLKAATHHIRNQSSLNNASNSSMPITVVSNRTYAHHVTPGYQDYQTVDENKIKIISSSNTSNGPAVFVLHIGPHKTASSVIQCDLTRYREELYKSASVAYLGRIYGHCLKKRRKNNKHTLNPRSVINNCFKTGGCERKNVWKKLESELAYLSAHNKHVILSDEAFARMQITSNHQQDNRKMLFDLVNRYYPGRMRVAVVYRRYYEWQLSLWNEFNKPFENGNGDASNYKKTYRNWPSEGGKRCHTFASFLEKLLDPEKTTRKRAHTESSYRDKAEANHVHAAQYFQGLWSNHSSEVRVLNLHKMNVHSENGEDVTSRFLQSTLTPLAAETYIRSKESGFGSRHNPSRDINYDMLAVAAYEHGLLANQTTTIPRAKVAMLLEEYLMKKKKFKNTTITNLPLQCPNEEQLKRFLQKSLHYEELLYPSQSNDDVTEHKMNFYEAVKKHKFCNFDFDALLEDKDVRTFFAEEIPLLYTKHNLKH